MSTYSKAAKNVAAIIFMGYGVIIILAMFVFSGELQPGLVIFSFYWTFFSLILVAVTACARFVVNDPVPGAAIRSRDPSKLKRLIVDSHTGEEVVISGSPKTTFREAALSDWQFSTIDKEGAWIIEDEHRNDITSSTLESYDSVAYIVPEKPRSAREGTIAPAEYVDDDEEKRYSTIDGGVEFFD
ncbi:hypothetical protein EU537_08275 [Candidatus Thorarchaeota archaeon]|nr:MAG: hypothetical protein EU537_08275 [Candidatus Thorarchaeota archaeon]